MRLYAPALVLFAGSVLLAVCESVLVIALVVVALVWSLVAHILEQQRRRPSR
jgi:hypothetical protein